MDNALKAINRTDTELTVGNYIVLFGGRDLEGLEPMTTRVAWTNPDGSRGEFFSARTDLESPYTKANAVPVNWEHELGEAGDDVLGTVDWKTARIDDKGVFVERVLNRRNQYVKWLEELGWFDDGTLGTSSQAQGGQIAKAATGEILRWPIKADTLTVSPMEPRNLTQNQLQAFKALGIPVPEDDKPGPEATPEAGTPAVVAAKARVLLVELAITETEE